MMSRPVAALFVLFVCIQCGAQSPEKIADAAAFDSKAVFDLLKSSNIEKAEILRISPQHEFFLPTTPENIRSRPGYKITIPDFQHSPLGYDFMVAYQKSNVSLGTASVNVEWACIFYDEHGVEVLSIYLRDIPGPADGVINGTVIKTNGELVRVLRSRCSSLWSFDDAPKNSKSSSDADLRIPKRWLLPACLVVLTMALCFSLYRRRSSSNK